MQIAVFTNVSGLKCAGILIGHGQHHGTIEIFWDAFYQLRVKLEQKGKLRDHDYASLGPRVRWVLTDSKTVLHEWQGERIKWTTPEHEALVEAAAAGEAAFQQKLEELRPKLYATYI